MSQLALLAPGSGGTEQPLQARLLARADDPATSKAAALDVSIRLVECQERALAVIRGYGPGTLLEIAEDAARVRAGTDPVRLYHELARRAPELERARKVMVQQNYALPCRGHAEGEPCHCHDVRVNGARVWEAC